MRNVFAFVFFLAAAYAPALVGAEFVPGQWYASLAKPEWNPPDWVFAPVWTVLYLLIGISGWLVWRAAGFTAAKAAMALYFAQLALNGLWSWLFFGLQLPSVAFAEILLLWFTILATVLLFRPISRTAALLLLPYLAWVGFAAVLNGAIWRLNG